VLWIARDGSPWHGLPMEFGAWNSACQRLGRRSRAGVWHLVSASPAHERRFRELFIDSTFMRDHQHATGAAKRAALKRCAAPEAA
jgi:transposase